MLRHSRFDGLTGWLINRLTAQARRLTQPLLLPRPQPRRFLMSWIEVMNHHQNPRTRTKISRATNAAKNFASLLLNASKSLTACSFRKLHFGQHPFHPRLGVRVEQVGKQQASLRAPRFSHPVGVGIFNRLGFCADHFRRLLCATRDNDRSTAFRALVSAASPLILKDAKWAERHDCALLTFKGVCFSRGTRPYSTSLGNRRAADVLLHSRCRWAGNDDLSNARIDNSQQFFGEFPCIEGVMWSNRRLPLPQC